jgi:hypothetical protein
MSVLEVSSCSQQITLSVFENSSIDLLDQFDGQSITIPVCPDNLVLDFGFDYSPLYLFAAGEQGVWYDPSDFSTMFQDASGTIPVTAIEQPVGRILDKSGRGNHASQVTSASRPILSARINLLTQTNNIVAATWPTQFITNATRTNASLSVTTNEGFVYIRTSSSNTLAATQHIASFDVVCDTTVANVPFRVSFGIGAGSALVSLTAGITQRVSITFTPQATTSNFAIGLDARNAIVPGGSNETGYIVTISNPDFRSINENVGIPVYQRVTTSTDYDVTGFPYYLRFDGIDDSMQTASINPGAVNKVQVFSGIRKISDAAQGVVAEWSANIGSNNGTFLLAAPDGATSTFGFDNKGTIQVDAVASSLVAPLIRIVTGLGDISGDTATIRINGVQADQDTADQGTGNYSTQALYIGRRNNASLPFNGRLYAFIVRFDSNNLSAYIIAETETWANGKAKAY